MKPAAAALAILGGAAIFWWRANAAQAKSVPEYEDEAQAKNVPDYIDAGIQAVNEGVEMIKKILFRGERNNNPGNIRLSDALWQGKIDGRDVAFETFASPVGGIRAMAKLLKNYQTIYGLNTVRGIIKKWAPASENDTAAYVGAVSHQMGVSPDATLDLTDKATLEKLVTAIIRHENGRVIYSSDMIARAVALA